MFKTSSQHTEVLAHIILKFHHTEVTLGSTISEINSPEWFLLLKKSAQKYGTAGGGLQAMAIVFCGFHIKQWDLLSRVQLAWWLMLTNSTV